MCGIAGVWNPRGDLETSVRRMTACIRHRGPNADGHQLIAQHGLALGHRRLAIVDLSPTGAQPMSSASGRFSIVFNGEIYNFQSLRTLLLGAGCHFRGTSDTEVMLAAFEHFGVREAIPHFAGMFAFSVWDHAENVLWLARDRMGEKPLYYGKFGGTFAWASELKSLRTLENCPRDIDPNAVADVLERGYIRGERTIHPGIVKLAPGSVLRVTRQGGEFCSQVERYWSVDQVLRESSAHFGDEEATDALEDVLRQVVSEEMMADVPVGAFLSGGIDSSLVVSMMQQVAASPVRTFTIAFDDAAFDESGSARRIASHLGTTHTEIRLAASDALPLVDRLPEIFDEPFADASQLPTLLVSRATRSHVTVALSGDGGDELFGGYSQYHAQDSVGRFSARIPRFARFAAAYGVSALPPSAFRLLTSNVAASAETQARLVKSLRSSKPEDLHESLLSEWVNPTAVMNAEIRSVDLPASGGVRWPAAASFREAQMAYDMQTYLPDDVLVKVDRSAMAVSLETRAPLLDHRIVEFALRQPLSHKIREGAGKYLLRQLLSRHVPSELWDRPKQGFAVPIVHWLRTDLKDWGAAMLDEDSLLRDWFRPKSIRRLWQKHQAGEDHADRLWRVLMVMQWLRSRAAALA